MAEKRPAEFPTDWHYQQRLDDLAREIQGRKDRLAWFESMEEDNPEREPGMKQTKLELKAARDQLNFYTKGPKTASKRPKAKAESRG